MKKIKAWAVYSPKGQLGIVWRPCPLWVPMPLAVFADKAEAATTADRYNENAIVPDYVVVAATITYSLPTLPKRKKNTKTV